VWNPGYYEIYYQSQAKLLIAKRSFKFTLTSLQLSRTVQLWNLEGFLGKRNYGKKLEKKTDPGHFSPNCTDPAHFVLPLFCEKALKTSDTRQNASERR